MDLFSWDFTETNPKTKSNNTKIDFPMFNFILKTNSDTVREMSAKRHHKILEVI